MVQITSSSGPSTHSLSHPSSELRRSQLQESPSAPSHQTLGSEYLISFHTSSQSSAGMPGLLLNHQRVLVSLLKMAQLWIVGLPPPSCIWLCAGTPCLFLATGWSSSLISSYWPHLWIGTPTSIRHLCSKGRAPSSGEVPGLSCTCTIRLQTLQGKGLLCVRHWPLPVPQHVHLQHYQLFKAALPSVQPHAELSSIAFG